MIGKEQGVVQSPLRAALAPILTPLRLVADLLVPPICLACSGPIATHGSLCPRCWTGIDFIRPPVCDRLGIPLPFDTGPGTVSARALAQPPTYGRARAVARHAGVMRALVHRFKYGDQHQLLGLFSRLLLMAGAELLVDADLLVPVPLARFRLWRRGFNQAALLASALGRQSGLKVEMLTLKRIRHTASQVYLPAGQRRDNVAGAFAIAPSRAPLLRGRKIVLIDDVVTTGATVEAAAKVLLKAGAARVDVLALTLVTDDIILPE